ncbi:sugar porter family MFS transporter [Haloarcula nitratireducens]|uniref:Sugar porter family MFS transporter n=1 Tax=Haloarcula nitratireducens TaxID=2487749 RepID=A0AAW4PG81_9EURY|nr:sugar porter family MFS transporter [Halomicroarcula nitratireducens]MBX0296888.1 sugar porter family MFS transporter [Halomicroarcula nitratireducens]
MSVLNRLLPDTEEDIGRFVVVAAGLAALSGLLFGFDTGVISGALLYINESFPVLAESSFLQGVVVSGSMFGAAIGAATGGWLADAIGRKRLIFAGGLLFFVGSAGMAISPTVNWLIVSRFVDGLGIGFASVVAPLYISEIAPPEVRGSLVTLNQIAITGGQLVSYVTNFALARILLDAGLTWRVMLGTGVIPAAILLLSIVFLPESPRWLVEQGEKHEARSVLTKIRERDDIGGEMSEIERMVDMEEEGLGELLEPWVRPMLIVGVGLAILQQAVGINAVIYYTPIILEATGFSNLASLVGTMGVGLINMSLSIVAALLLDRVGRRPLLLVGFTGMFATLSILGGLYYFVGLSTTIGMIALAMILLFVAFHAVSIGSIYWLMSSEIFPLNIRGTAIGVCTVILWLGNFAVAQLFPMLFDIGPAIAFWTFAAVAVIGVVFTYSLVPETKGRSLEEIESDLRDTAIGKDNVELADRPKADQVD